MTFIAIICNSVKITKAKEVSCERYSDLNWGGNVGLVKTCYLWTTSIDEPDVTISAQDNSITGVTLYGNKKIVYLPIGVGEKFSNLIGYTAGSCSIIAISRGNFKALNKTKFLNLNSNQIEKIASDTFIELNNLEELYLSKKFLLNFSV